MIRPEDLSKPASSEVNTLDDPLQHLQACHNRIEERLATIERTARGLGDKTDEALSAAEACIRFFDSNGVLHTQDEEESLFPRLLPRLTESDRDYLAELERQHREAEAAYGEWKDLVGRLRAGNEVSPQIKARYAALAASLCELYWAHIASENNRLVRLSRATLTPAETTEIAREMKRRRGLSE